MTKGLDCLERLKSINESGSGYIEKYYIEPIEKELKALEIIKKVALADDDLSGIIKCENYIEYEEWSWNYELTEQNFEILKEVISNE